MNQTKTNTLQLFRYQAPVTVLGPEQRAVIWVQGCHFACSECIVPESWSLKGGETMTVADLADWVLAQSKIEGITLSGGDPLLQAPALVQLIETVQAQRDLGVMCYTGYQLECLHQKGNVNQKALLDIVDLLVDGTYQKNKHEELRWRGSANQRLIYMSDRYLDYLGKEDSSVGIEVGMDQGGVFVTGVPHRPGFRKILPTLEQNLLAQGINISF